MAAPPPKAADGSVIARIIAAHARPAEAPADRAPSSERAFGRALRHAGAPFAGLGLSLREVHFTADTDLLTAIEAQPDYGMITVLEDPNGRRGLLALSHGLVDALIEVQTTGRVEPASLAPRTVTQIDEALSRDYIDLLLAAFTQETGGVEGRDWPERMSFGSRVMDRSQLNLLLPEGRYHLFRADLGFAGTERTGQAVMVLPADPALARRDLTSPVRTEGEVAAWKAALASTLADTPLWFDAVLMRITRPLGDVQRLAPGDLIPFAASDLQSVSLEDRKGRVVLTGRLGQLGGKRALRLTGPDAAQPAEPAAAPPESQPVPAPAPASAPAAMPTHMPEPEQAALPATPPPASALH